MTTYKVTREFRGNMATCIICHRSRQVEWNLCAKCLKEVSDKHRLQAKVPQFTVQNKCSEATYHLDSCDGYCGPSNAD